MSIDDKTRLVTLPALRTEFGILLSRSHITRLEAAELFPKRVYVAPGGRHIAWLASEIREYVAARASARAALPSQSTD